ncbi:accessory Sec system protein Asp3 [Staphylococcus delphini]|uniref:Accessory Sec system protein Asp3 n=1 Tax=Staphylococcus delphini TaxID=53344 RepID=A0AAQ0D7D2_9STAP|nr:accessory Sec system protein Asp3 [Staphylococcus delphini]QUM67158.1 accessory Sec system protein Asp3 [Staphylococcus delphini]QUM69603.1 accessory Sec system protein Asp3 [Staphylococcus delphini]
MKEKHQFNIRWTQITPETFMYGSILRFKATETLFENELMPSGIVIHEWKMMTNFEDDKVMPTLPILQRNQTYRFHFDYHVQPVDSVYFKVIFKRRNGTVCDYQMIKGHDKDITVPDEMYSYVVQIINAASQHLTFRQLTIEDVREQSKAMADVHVHDMCHIDPDATQATVIFVEETDLAHELIQEIDNCVCVTGWDQPHIGHVIAKVTASLQTLAKDYTLQLVGYGSRSNEMAYAVGAHLPATLYVTPQRDTKLRQRYGTPEQVDVPVVTYQYDEASTAISHWLGPTLNQSHQLKGLDIQKLNGGNSA